MKFIKSNSVNFSKNFNFDGSSEDMYSNFKVSDVRNDDEALKRQQEEYAAELQAAEDERIAKENEAAAEEYANATANLGTGEVDRRTPQEIDRDNYINHYDKTQALTSKMLRQKQLADIDREAEKEHNNKVKSLMQTDIWKKNLDEQDAEDSNVLNEAYGRGKTGGTAASISSSVLGGVKGATNWLGNLIGNNAVGNYFTKKSAGIDPAIDSNKFGNWVDGVDNAARLKALDAQEWANNNPKTAALAGAGALLGAGALAYGAHKLATKKKEVSADAYYAFAPGEIEADNLIGGPYYSRKAAREAKPEAGHILKGSTLSAYGDFKVA